MDKWITTDSDNLQFMKVANSKTKFTFKEFNRFEYPEEFKIYKDKHDIDLKPIWNVSECWIELTIDLSEYSFTELLRHVTTYYKGLDVLINQYKEDSEKILAECIFEQENGLY